MTVRKPIGFSSDDSPDISGSSGRQGYISSAEPKLKHLGKVFEKQILFLPGLTDGLLPPIAQLSQKSVQNNTDTYVKGAAKPLHEIIGKQKDDFHFLLAFAHNLISLIK